MTTSIQSNRLDYLDAVRAFALLLGIVFHACLSFMPMFIGWAVMDISTSSFIPTFVLVSHSFRMELFFLIAGFFSHMTFHGKGTGSFLKSRCVRIAVPFVLGWFILRPLIVASWFMGGESMRGDVNILTNLKLGFESLSALPTDLLTGSHLWFLYYILLVTAVTLTLRWTVALAPSIQKLFATQFDRATAWVASSPFSLLVISIPTAAVLWFMNNWGMDTPDKSLIPHLPVLALYGGFFIFGWLLHRQRPLIGQFARLTIGRAALCVAAIVDTILLSRFQMDTGHPQITLIRATFMLSYALMMWTLVALSIGLFKRFLDKPSKTIRYVADSSYWLYLIHLPVVVWLQIAFAELPFHWSIKLVSISVITVGLSLVLYDILVRPTIVGKVLNGQKKNSALFSCFRNNLKQSQKADITV